MKTFSILLACFCVASKLHRVLAEPANSIEQGKDVGDGQVMYDLPFDPKSVKEITFVSPIPNHPYYEIAIPFAIGPRANPPPSRRRADTDSGKPSVVSDSNGRVTDIYKQIARRVSVKIGETAVHHSAKFPNIVISNT